MCDPNVSYVCHMKCNKEKLDMVDDDDKDDDDINQTEDMRCIVNCPNEMREMKWTMAMESMCICLATPHRCAIVLLRTSYFCIEKKKKDTRN